MKPTTCVSWNYKYTTIGHKRCYTPKFLVKTINRAVHYMHDNTESNDTLHIHDVIQWSVFRLKILNKDTPVHFCLKFSYFFTWLSHLYNYFEPTVSPYVKMNILSIISPIDRVLALDQCRFVIALLALAAPRSM